MGGILVARGGEALYPRMTRSRTRAQKRVNMAVEHNTNLREFH